jgi:hypothetical protein
MVDLLFAEMVRTLLSTQHRKIAQIMIILLLILTPACAVGVLLSHDQSTSVVHHISQRLLAVTTFSYVSAAPQTFVVPLGVSVISMTISGAAGGDAMCQGTSVNNTGGR